MRKTMFRWLIALAILLPCMVVAASAASGSVVASGSCGFDVSFTLWSDGELVISGVGDMYDYESYSDIPWEAYSADYITRITVQDGVTSIGNLAFAHCFVVSEVVLPGSLMEIGRGAFFECLELSNLDIPSGVTEIGESAFTFCVSLKRIVIPDGVTILRSFVFDNTRCDYISIGRGVTTIENFDAFATRVEFRGNAPTIVEYFWSSNNYCYAGTTGWDKFGYYDYDGEWQKVSVKVMDETQAAYEELVNAYPQYLENKMPVNQLIGSVEEACFNAVDDYSDAELLILAANEGFFNGTEIVLGALTAFLKGEKQGDKWLDEATLKFMQEVEAQEMVLYDSLKTTSEVYKNLEFAYGVTEAISKDRLAAAIAEQSEHLTSATINEIVDYAFENYEELGISKAFDATGKAFDIVDLTTLACQLHDTDIETIEKLLSFVNKNSALYRGLTRLKASRERDAAAFVIDNFLTKEVSSWAGKQIVKYGKNAWIAICDVDPSVAMAVVEVVGTLWYDIVYPKLLDGVKITDINTAIIMQEFYLAVSSARMQKYQVILMPDKYSLWETSHAMEDYEFLWDVRISALGSAAKACAKIAKNDYEKDGLEQYEDKIKELLYFDHYITYCHSAVKKAISDGVLSCKHYRVQETGRGLPSCSSNGYVNVYCSTCNREFTSGVFPAYHSYTLSITDPTCTEQGYKQFLCTACGYLHHTEYVAAIGHNAEGIVEAVKSTCTTTGLTEGKCCSRCGTITVAQAVVAPLGHIEKVVPGEWNTCTTDGWTAGKACRRCGVTLEERQRIPADHDEIVEPGIPATCTEPGWNGDTVCQSCGYVLEHGGPIEALGHTEVTIPGVAPTCTASGLTSDIYCSFCDEVISVQEVLPPLGHRIAVKWSGLKHPVVVYNTDEIPFVLKEGTYYSNNHSDNSSSRLCIVAENDCALVLHYGVSSEAGFDILYVAHNGIPKHTISGEVFAQTMMLTLTAGDLVTVCYTKDGSANVREDRGWVALEYELLPWTGDVDVSADAFDADCTNAVVCEYCQAVAKPALGHDYIDHAAKTPTTESVGWEAYQTCSRCDYSTYKELPKLPNLTVTSNPKSVSVTPGTAAKFSVTATGTDLTYQWQYMGKNGTTWANTSATGNKTAIMTVPAAAVTAGISGNQYRCKITDANGDVIYSAAATLTVKTPLAVAVQPKSITVNAGTAAKFSVTATGTDLTYQWQYMGKNGIAWANTSATGNKTATMTVPAAAVTAGISGNQYRCKITDANGDVVYSAAATLTVKTPLAVAVQPKSITVDAGTAAKFSVTATGSGLTYQWQYKGKNGTTWANTSAGGNKTATMTVPASAVKKGIDGNQYRCVIKDAYGNEVYSNAATLTVK